MINLKLSVILGCSGMVLSLLTGLLSGAGFPLIFVRAILFGLVFFGFGCGIWILINNFIPEVMFSEASAEAESEIFDAQPGSRVNITLDDSKVLSDMYRTLNDGENVGNIEDLVSGAFKQEESAQPQGHSSDAGQGMDQITEDGYTGNGNWRNSVSSNPQTGLHDSQESIQNTQGGLDNPNNGLLDLDSMAGSFLGSTADSEPVNSAEPFVPAVRSPLGNKAQKLDGDFNPRELAAGIRTVLNKDE